MNPAHPRRFPRFPGLRLLAGAIPAAGAMLTAGCALPEAWVADRPAPAPAVHRAARPADVLPAPEDLAAPAKVEGKHVVPIALDTVLHLAEEQNEQVALAREKLHESLIEKDLADWSWLPTVHAGMAYWRHEGGIQDQDGSLVKSSTHAMMPGLDMKAQLDVRETAFQRVSAERKIWQQQGELSRITSETLLEASNTYIDLLSVRASEAVLEKISVLEKDVLKWAEALFKQEKSAEVLVETIRAQQLGREQALAQARMQGDAAAAKLGYLLGVGPNVVLDPIESKLIPVDLVDAGQPTDVLVARALQAGPGVRELEQMLALIQSAMDAACGPSRFLPVLELYMQEGPFGAGPNSTMFWDNRWDMGVSMRWNLTDLLTARQKKDLAQSKLQQVELGYRDLRGKLTLGVQEAQQAVQTSKKLIDLGADQVRHADRSYKLSDLRLKQRVEGSSTAEVLAAIRILEMSHLTTLNAIRSHNKAQVRLMVLMGAAGGKK